MPLVHACTRPGCNILTMGELCVEHEREAERRAPEPGPVHALVHRAQGVAKRLRRELPQRLDLETPQLRALNAKLLRHVDDLLRRRTTTDPEAKYRHIAQGPL